MTKTSLVAGPASLPVSAAELRTHLWTIYPEKTTDDYLELLLKAATSHIETITWRKLVSQQHRLYLDRWPNGPIYLPFGVVSAVASLKWLDSDGGDHTVAEADYIKALYGPEPMLLPSDTWPAGELFDAESIRVDFTCGFGTAADVPAELRQAIQLLAAHWYETREAVIVGTTVRKVPFAVDALVDPWKIRRA